ncbi:hypothetical protein M3O96_19110 [Aquiflexum sp. TKW24L]|uniref:hypothetical protein n=1 Tax=Aquiflexum sp. TKW24L TaxID=2942212 RepID=UPI0020BFB46A|nr:hypothetical protein [Aquiflexum sp. TKW24L]MCL6261219.1 hypothetical protein [Aquiflexum sp. TKW24L]
MSKTHLFNLSILTGIFLLVNGLWFWKMGIMTDDDTWGYLQYANEIKENGLFFKPHLFWYIGYVLFILGANSMRKYGFEFFKKLTFKIHGLKISGKRQVLG